MTEAPPPCGLCAELRALFGPLMDEADWHVEGCDCAGCVWFARARAALAPKEGT